MALSAGLQLLFLLFAIWSSPAATRKIYAAGSGLDMLSLPETVNEILALSGKRTPTVLYLGTATYDEPEAQKTQTQGFANAGCSVTALKVAVDTPALEDMQDVFAKADIVVVSGGNTLFAHDRWVKLGVDKMIREAAARDVVLCGGSAGGIVWFDGGHSDSMEPGSYKNPPGPLLNPSMTKEVMNAWAYIRAPGTGVLSGLFCPHYDVTEGNGLLRADDFTELLRQHSGENGIGVDNWGALKIDGDTYTVISRAGKPGSVKDGKFTSKRDGVPGAWKLGLDTHGNLIRELIPETGHVGSFIAPARYIVQSSMLPVARAQNPDDGRPAAWNFTVAATGVVV